MAHTLFVGLGSSHGDDCVGWLVADRLGVLIPDGLEIRKAATPAEILDWIGGVDRLVICDACFGAGSAGQVFRWTWPELPVGQLRHRGSHDMSLSDVLELTRRLGRLPENVEVWGIDVMRCEPGASLSPELAAVVPAVARDIAENMIHA